MGFLLHNRTIYLDRYTAVGDWTRNLVDLVVPEARRTIDPPTSISITGATTGTVGHFTSVAGVIGISTAGDTANLSDNIYNLTITATWSGQLSPYNTDTATLRIICPATSVYVDPATGVDTNPGTKALPWAHSPDDILASGVSASFVASVETLCVHKNGSFIRSQLNLNQDKLVNATDVGWGSGGPATYCGADLLGTALTPTSGEVSNNPNIANIKKFDLGFKRGFSQGLLDRSANKMMQWAQWPSVVGDVFLESHDPQRHMAGGMYRLPETNVPFTGTGDNKIILGTLTLPAEAITKFGSNNLTGYWIGLWVRASFVVFFEIKGHNTSTNVITFDPNGNKLQSVDGLTAFQIVGHPLSIEGPGQYAWNPAGTIMYAWTNSGSNPEIMKRGYIFNAAGRTSGAVFGFVGEGAWGDGDGDGVGWGKSDSSPFTYMVLSNTFRWMSNRIGNGGGVRILGQGLISNMLIEGNAVYECNGGTGARLSRISTDCIIRANRFEKLNVTASYAPGATRIIFEFNILKDVVGPHANGFTIYTDKDVVLPPDNIIRYNTFENVCRALTFDPCLNLLIHRNIFEIDSVIRDAIRFYNIHASTVVTENIFTHRRNTPKVGDDTLAAGTPGHGRFERNVIAGLTGGAGEGSSAQWLNNLLSYSPSNGTNITTNTPPADSTAVWTGNVLDLGDFAGNLLPSWRKRVGVGPLGAGQMIRSYAVIPGVVDQTLREISSEVTSSWVGPVSADGLVNWNITNGTMAISANSSGTSPTSHAASGTATDINGKYVQFKLTASAEYDTVKTLSADLGDGNITLWNVKTKQKARLPLAVTGISNWWRASTSTGIGPTGSNSAYMTFMFAGRIDSIITGPFVGHYNTNIRVMVEWLNTNRLRLRLVDASGTIIAAFNSPIITDLIGKYVEIQLAVDLTKDTVGEGVKFYVNGVDMGTSTATTWPTGATNRIIEWEKATQDARIWGQQTGLLGYMFLDNRLIDIADPNVRAKTTPYRIGVNGENIFGTPPLIFVAGDQAYYNHATANINRGRSLMQFIRQAGGSTITLDSGGSTSWPAVPYATALTNLAGGRCKVGEPTTFTVDINGALMNPVSITPSDGGKGGVFTPTSVTVADAPNIQSATFDYTPTTDGQTTITVASAGLTSANVIATVVPAFTALTKGVPTTISYSQLISILQQLAATPNGLINGSIKFSYPKNDGSRLTKIINTSYIVEAHDTVDNINVSITPTEVINLNIHTSNYSIPVGNQVTVTNVAENPLEIRYIA